MRPSVRESKECAADQRRFGHPLADLGFQRIVVGIDGVFEGRRKAEPAIIDRAELVEDAVAIGSVVSLRDWLPT